MFFLKIKPVASGLGFIILFIILSIGSYALYDFSKDSTSEDGSNKIAENTNCNVAGINIRGGISTYVVRDGDGKKTKDYFDGVASEDVNYEIEKAEKNEKIKAILIEIDSGGGNPVAAEEIANAIKASKKPTVALIRESGLSAAYWLATGANHIFASRNSDVGSIGINSSYMDDIGKNKKDGRNYIQLMSGKYKNSGSPNKPLTEEDRILLMRDVKIYHQNFIEDVSKNRNLPIEKVRAIADGSSVLGQKAKELGLIDEIGGVMEVKKYLEEKIGEKAEICWE